jgi:hypothetical protein
VAKAAIGKPSAPMIFRSFNKSLKGTFTQTIVESFFSQVQEERKEVMANKLINKGGLIADPQWTP